MAASVRNPVKLFVCLFFIVWAAGCDQAKSPAALAPVKSVYASRHCTVDQAGIMEITTAAQLSEVVGTAQPGESAAGVDFSREQVFLIAMGAKNTAGYGLRLSGDTANNNDGVLVLPVDSFQPEPGAMLAQVRTTPCLVLSLPRSVYRVVEAAGMRSE